MRRDWIAVFPAVFTEDHRALLGQIEHTGFINGLREAAKIATSYDLEEPDADIICRCIAREIMDAERDSR